MCIAQGQQYFISEGKHQLQLALILFLSPSGDEDEVGAENLLQSLRAGPLSENPVAEPQEGWLIKTAQMEMNMGPG